MNGKQMASVLVLLALGLSLLFPAGTVAAEAPPPPGEAAGPAPLADPDLPDAEEPDEQDAAEGENRVDPPLSAPDAVSSAVQALYQADGALTDLNGNPVALAADLAARALLDSDPQGCPPGVKPTWLGGTGAGCTSNYATLALAIADASVISGWTVYAQAGDYPEAGGLTINKSISVVGQDPASTSIGIGNTVTLAASNITLRDFTINGHILANGLTGTLKLENLSIHAGAASGIYISDHSGSITLNQVDSSGNYRGAYIKMIATTPTVTVRNSYFNNCDGGGLVNCLHIDSLGPVRLENVNASGNLHGSGAYVVFGGSLSVKNSVFSNNHNAVALDDWGYGLYVENSSASGTVSLTDVTAWTNQEAGIYAEAGGSITVKNTAVLNNVEGGLLLTTDHGSLTLDRVSAQGNDMAGIELVGNGSGTTTVTNTDVTSNWGLGLDLDSGGSVVMRNITGAGNTMTAVSINNLALATAARSVSLTNIQLSSPGVNGLMIISRGTVTLNHIQADGFANYGVAVDNCWDDPSPALGCRSTAGVTLTNTAGQNIFTANANGNLILLSSGTISVRGVTSMTSAAGLGLALDNSRGAGSISLNQATAVNNDSGIEAVSRGSITLSKVTVLENSGIGALLSNTGAASARPVSVSDGVFEDNVGDGLIISSLGSVTLNHVSSSANDSQAGSIFAPSGAVTISSSLGHNHFDGNLGGGFDITAFGTVSIRDASFDDNAGDGLNLTNTRAASLTLTNVSADRNAGDGLFLTTQGSVTFTRVRARENGGDYFGAVVSNFNTSYAYPVTISHGDFSANHAGGLLVGSRGVVTLNHVTANLNHATAGVVIDNCYIDPAPGGRCRSSASVRVLSTLGRSTFDQNAGMGSLIIHSGGSVTLSGISASRNAAGMGAMLMMEDGIGNLSVSNSQFDDNTAGLTAVLMGSATVSNVTANRNQLGLGIRNLNAAAPKTISVSNSIFDDNTMVGLVLLGPVNVTLNHVSASRNTGTTGGLYIDTCNIDPDMPGLICSYHGTVTISNTLGPNVFDRNDTVGMKIVAGGKVSLTGVSASYTNDGNGATITNGTAAEGVTADITITNATFNNNDIMGLDIGVAGVGSRGKVTLSKVIASSNGGYGIYVENIPAVKSVSLSNIIANKNLATNIVVLSRASITLNAVQAANSGLGSGVELDNCIFTGGFCTGSGDVQILSTLGRNNFTNNGAYGLKIDTFGSVVVNQTLASGNGGPINDNDGIYVYLRGPAATATIYCSTFTHNNRSGLFLNGLAGQTLTLKGVLLASNDVLGGVVSPDLFAPAVTVVTQKTACP